MSIKTKGKVLFVVRALPFEAAGTPVVIRNLLANLPEEGYYVIGRRPHPEKQLPNDVRQKMFQIPILYTKGHRFWKYFSILPGLFMGLWIIKKYKITKLVGVFQDDASLILAYLLAFIFPKIEFYPYLMDLYAEQYQTQEKLQQKMFKRAKMILVVNNGIRELLSAKYKSFNFQTVSIIASNSVIPSTNVKTYELNDIVNIVYSGSVNADRIETLKKLTKIISTDKRFRFKYLTHHSELFLRNEAVYFDGFQLHHCNTNEELMKELNQADLLYLPIRFNYESTKKEQMQTVFGAKTFEYLVSQTPIFAHCPKEFYNGQFLSENKAAFVLNSMEEVDIRNYLDYILRVYSNTGPEMVDNAHKAAEQFSPQNVIKKFSESIDTL